MRKKRIASLLLALALCLTLLPAAAMAEEAEGEFTITFNAAPGAFKDGSTTRTAQTASGEEDSTKHLAQIPEESPERSGYVFRGWVTGDGSPVTNVQFTADATVTAQWDLNSNLSFPLDPNGGTVSPDHFNVDESFRIIGRLPTPTRPGYVFQGWYIDGKRVDESQPLASTAPFPVAQWKRASKVSPSVSASPAGIDAGASKVELTLSCGGGAAFDWRPLERILFGGAPGDPETAAKRFLSGNFSAVGLKLTGVMYEGDVSVNDGAYPYELYPEGVYPTPQLVLTLEGAARAGSLTIELSPGVFVLPVAPGDDTVLTETSGEIFNSARVTVPVSGGAAPANPDGPFTVKFDLNYTDPKWSEIPKDQTVRKGAAVSLPDGTKLTPPSSAYEFYAWCLLDSDGKLFPWNESHAVTSDMTLYAGWVKKGKVIVDGVAVDAPSGSKPVEAPKPSEPEKPAETPKPAAPAFTDVPAASPFAPAIAWAVEKGVTNGKTAATFAPGEPCTRAQIVTFLWRAAGSPEPKLTETQYMDVTNTDAYYYKAVQWAAEMEMEYSGTFSPGGTCTRAAAVYFIWKASGSPKAGARASFTDMPEEPEDGSQWYWPDLPDSIDWAVEQGVTTGTGDGTTFSPDNPCTRGQIVTFLYRAYEHK